jgi:hypothetical protein
MAEYRYGNSLQGFSHLMNNLNVYQAWALGTIQEVLNGAVYKPSGVCANQCWSETMVLQPALEGMLGLDIDAAKGRLKMAPALPADWDSLEVRNIRIGGKIIGMQFKRNDNVLSYSFNSEFNDSLIIDFAPLLPSGTRILSCRLNQRDVPFSAGFTPAATIVKLELKPKGVDLVELEFRNGISVLPVVQDPKPGYSSEGLRIIEAGLLGNIYSVTTENKAGTSSEIRFWFNGVNIDHVENGIVLATNGKICTIQVLFPDQGKKYTEVPLKIYLK